MGRPRKPVAAKILDGSFRADRDGDPSTLVLPGGTPQPPPDLAGEALAFWHKVVPGLVATRIAAACDTPSLAMMCEWWARYRTYARRLDEAPADKNTYQLMLQVGIATTNFDRLASRFGLTPADRNKLRVDAGGGRLPVAARKRG